MAEAVRNVVLARKFIDGPSRKEKVLIAVPYVDGTSSLFMTCLHL